MAGDWIKLEHATVDKPEVHQISGLLGLPPEHVVGCLARVWIWCDQQIESGNAASVTKNAIDRITFVPGFGNAMEKSGWLLSENERCLFPNFERHNGKTAKRRALTAKRVSKFKTKKGNAKGNSKVTHRALPSLLFSYSSLLKEKRDVSNGAIDVPAVLDNERFAAAWADWERHRQDIRKPLTETSVRKQLHVLSGLGLDRAVETIEHTIEKGWTGLREPDGAPKKNRSDEEIPW